MYLSEGGISLYPAVWQTEYAPYAWPLLLATCYCLYRLPLPSSLEIPATPCNKTRHNASLSVCIFRGGCSREVGIVDPIRVYVVADFEALRIGLSSVLDSDPGLEKAGEAAGIDAMVADSASERA